MLCLQVAVNSQDISSSDGEQEIESKKTENSVKKFEDESQDGVDSENNTPEHIIKKQKCGVCITCIGLLQWGCSADAIKLVRFSVTLL